MTPTPTPPASPTPEPPPGGLPEGWQIALGKAASKLRFDGHNHPNFTVGKEWTSVASILTELENALCKCPIHSPPPPVAPSAGVSGAGHHHHGGSGGGKGESVKRFVNWFLAYFHLSDSAVCELSTDRRDYHDYQDSEHGLPFHFCTMRCKRCGREFSI